ncbi:MAG: hypothetical protein QG625_243, partial [Cyanobacteriota bacterium erpe_2018_sw_39hr_WHONDRS-SW48-000098_B_bin.30]|nr:hypothetical protein [Cyanobacteriota bacterium erpe_2018_sw_39hr_WHONDRS-SW48-000098_B_bin.30]
PGLTFAKGYYLSHGILEYPTFKLLMINNVSL